MKRLTKKEQLAGHTVNYVCYDNCFDVWSVPKKFMGNAIDRLAAYEETGLEPKEIEQLKGEAFGLKVDKQELEQYRALGPIDRLRELAQADREGISPCTFCKFNPPLDIVNSAPTIDAVRAAGGCYCQECKYADYPIGPNILCKKFYGAGSIDGFCYWGQQKEADHEVSE